MPKKDVKKSRRAAVINTMAKHRRLVIWVIVAVAVSLIAYGSCIGANMSTG
jgi:hypothetical protein